MLTQLPRNASLEVSSLESSHESFHEISGAPSVLALIQFDSRIEKSGSALVTSASLPAPQALTQFEIISRTSSPEVL